MTQSAVSSLVKTDPDKAKDYVNALTDKAARKSAIDGLISGLAQEDPQLAIDFAEQLTDPVEKKAALGEAYEDMANKDPAAVAELFLSQKINKVGDFDLGDLVYRYARKDLDGARDLVDRIEDPIHRDKAIGRLISQWSSEDPAAALAYTREQPVTSGIESAMYTLPKGSARNNFLYSLFDEWAENDIESAISALPILHQQDPKKSHERLYGQIATEYVDQPEKATQWLGTIENAKDRNTATRNFVTGWAKDEPNKAADWVNTIQDTGQRDAAVRSLVNTFDNTEPSYALEWATSLSDNKTRASDVTRTYNKWKKRDPNGAQQWLNSTQLIGESLKEKLAK